MLQAAGRKQQAAAQVSSADSRLAAGCPCTHTCSKLRGSAYQGGLADPSSMTVGGDCWQGAKGGQIRQQVAVVAPLQVAVHVPVHVRVRVPIRVHVRVPMLVRAGLAAHRVAAAGEGQGWEGGVG